MQTSSVADELPPGRVAVLRELLEGLVAFTDPMQSRAGGDGVSLPLMPETYTRSVREVERIMRAMREDRVSPLVRLESGERVSVRQLRWHLHERFLRCERVQRPLTYRGGRWAGFDERCEAVVAVPGGWALTLAEARQSRRGTVVGEFYAVVARWDRKVRAELVERGLVEVALRWRLGHEPMLPDAKVQEREAA